MHCSLLSSNGLIKRSSIASGSATHVLFYCRAGCHQFVQPCHAIKPRIKYQYNCHAADGTTTTSALESTSTNCLLLSIHFVTTSNSTADADDFSTMDCFLLAIHLAAASIPTAAADASLTTPAHLILTTHSDTTITTATTANSSNTTTLMLIAIQFAAPKSYS
jgi:hypothetical protein